MDAADDYLRRLAYDGLAVRVPDYGPEYADRLEYELTTMADLGFSDYHIIVAEILNWAKDRGILCGPGRGSAGGSLVLYATNATDLDPIAFNLVFERYVNRERVSWPDVDSDIPDDRRKEVIEHIADKYGRDRVAQILTLGTFGAKKALKSSARVLGYPYSTGEGLAGRIPPPVRGRAFDLSCIREDDLEPEELAVYALARGLEGTIAESGVHPGGIVISPVPLSEIMPVFRRPTEKDGSISDILVTGYDMNTVAAMGLVKYDFLGVKNLRIINDTLSMLRLRKDKQDSGAPARLLSSGGLRLPRQPDEFNDRRTLDLLRSGDTLGCFQLDSPGMRGLLRQVRPDNLYDLAAVLSLYRPGPMDSGSHTEFARRKSGTSPTQYPHPEFATGLASVLGRTYGLIVFQEQVLDTLITTGGYTYGTADVIFNAMRKKDQGKMAAARPEYLERLKAKGYSRPAADALWEVLLPFADYSFNLAHATGYAFLAYWEAMLKAHYPNEFMAALLTAEGDPNKLHQYLDEARKMGVPILPPDINTSEGGFTATGDGIRYGLASIKGVGVQVAAAIRKGRPFRGLDDFFMRSDKILLNSATLAALAGAGAMDSLHADRAGFREDAVRLADLATVVRKNKAKGDTGLRRASFKVSASRAKDVEQYRKWERELLGVSLSTDAVLLRLDRPLSQTEWTWVRQVVDSNRGDAALSFTYHGWKATMKQRVRWSETLADTLALLGVAREV